MTGVQTCALPISVILENGKGANYGLYFSRMTAWRKHGDDLKAEYLARVVETKKGPKEEYAPDIERMGEKSPHILRAASVVLEAIHTRQTDILKTEAARGGMVWEFRARLLNPYVSGLGSGHPTETGMILDRNSGLPFIPASAIKGVLRMACALHIAETEPDAVVPSKKEPGHLEIPDGHRILRRYFGDTITGKADSVRGQLVFLDAFPATPLSIKTDIMNPHFGKYYAGDQGPLETENPIPVKFLAVAPATEFVFRCFVSPLPEQGQGVQVVEVTRRFDSNDEQSVIAMFTGAFEQLGFGSKTSIGYGRFVLVAKNTADYFKGLVAQDVERHLQEEEQRRQEEEIRRYPWRPLLVELEQTTDWGMFRQKFLDNKKLQEHQTQREVAERVKALAEQLRAANQKKWEQARDELLENWLAPSGLNWQTKDGGNSSVPRDPRQEGTLRECAYTDWNQFKNNPPDLAGMSLEALKALQECFIKQDWNKKPPKKKAKPAQVEKYQAWLNILQRIQDLEQ